MSVIRSGSNGTYLKASTEFKNGFFWDVKFEVLHHNSPSDRDLLAGGGRRIGLTTRTTQSWGLGKPVWGQLPEECLRASTQRGITVQRATGVPCFSRQEAALANTEALQEHPPVVKQYFCLL